MVWTVCLRRLAPSSYQDSFCMLCTVGIWGVRGFISPYEVSDCHDEKMRAQLLTWWWCFGCKLLTLRLAIWFPNLYLNWRSKAGWTSWVWNNGPPWSLKYSLLEKVPFIQHGHVWCCCRSLAKHSFSTFGLWYCKCILLFMYAAFMHKFILGHWEAFCCSENQWPASCMGQAALTTDCTSKESLDF